MTDGKDPDSQGAAAEPLQFKGTYQEAFDMLVEARNYVEHCVPVFRYSANPPDPAVMTKETMRLTSRLTQVMAWLMAQRAVQEGEIKEAEFVEDKYRLEGHEVCLKRDVGEQDELPAGLGDLMDRSYALYNRVMRLDRQYTESKRDKS